MQNAVAVVCGIPVLLTTSSRVNDSVAEPKQSSQLDGFCNESNQYYRPCEKFPVSLVWFSSFIAKTIELLDCFGSATESLTLEEVVKRTGFRTPLPTAFCIPLYCGTTSPSQTAVPS